MEWWGILIIEKAWLQKWNFKMKFQYDSPPSNSIFKRVGMLSGTRQVTITPSFHLRPAQDSRPSRLQLRTKSQCSRDPNGHCSDCIRGCIGYGCVGNGPATWQCSWWLTTSKASWRLEAHPSSSQAVARAVPNQKSFSEKIWGTDVNRHSHTYEKDCNSAQTD